MRLRSCFSSPIKRARRFAELTWAGRTAPLIYLDTLKEAHLGWLQGMSQGARPTRPSVHSRMLLFNPTGIALPNLKYLIHATCVVMGCRVALPAMFLLGCDGVLRWRVVMD